MTTSAAAAAATAALVASGGSGAGSVMERMLTPDPGTGRPEPGTLGEGRAAAGPAAGGYARPIC
jgi:hypothetical protein